MKSLYLKSLGRGPRARLARRRVRAAGRIAEAVRVTYRDSPLPDPESLVSACDPDSYARVSIADTADGRVHVALEAREFRAFDEQVCRGDRGFMAMPAWERPSSNYLVLELDPQPTKWATVKEAVFDNDQVADIDATMFDYKQESQTRGAAQAERERAVRASALLGRLMTERMLRELDGRLHGVPGRDYPQVVLRTSFNDSYQTVWVQVMEGGGTAYGIRDLYADADPAHSFYGDELSFENMVACAERLYPMARDLLVARDERWFDAKAAEDAQRTEAEHQRMLARQTVDAVKASVHAA